MMKRKILILLVAIVGIICTACGATGTEKTAKVYCEILIKGDYGNILDIAYLPESEFITEEKVNEAKQVYFEKMKEKSSSISKCTPTEVNDTDESIEYKLTMEGSEGENTSSIKVRKEDNKIVIDDVYRTETVKVFKDSVVYIDGKEISIKPEEEIVEGNHMEVYTFTILSYAEYSVKVTNSLFEDEEFILNYEIIHGMPFPTEGEKTTFEKLKDPIKEELDNNLSKMLTDIVTVSLKGNDANSLNEYFVNGDAKEFFKDNANFREEVIEEWNKYDVEFHGISSHMIDDINCINENELFVSVSVFIDTTLTPKSDSNVIVWGASSLERNMVWSFDINYTKNNGKWLISTWENPEDYGEDFEEGAWLN